MIPPASFPLNIIHQIPIESPNKMFAINAAAYLAGTWIGYCGNPILNVTAIAIALYGTFQGISVCLFHPDKMAIQKTTHAAFVFFSALSGAATGDLVIGALKVKIAALHFFASPSPYNGLQGVSELAKFVGITYPLTKYANRSWASGCRSIKQWGGPADSIMDYAPIREYALTSRNFRTNAKNFLVIYELHHNLFYSPLILDRAQFIEILFGQALSKATDKEWEQLLSGSVEIQLNHKETFLSRVRHRIDEILLFCQTFETEINQVKEKDSLNKLETALARHTQNALRFLSIFPNETQPLKEAYLTYLINDEKNPFRASLKKLAKTDEKEDEEDVFFFIPDIFRETDCCQYVKELGLSDIPGKAYTQIFHRELERLGLDTIKALNDQGFDCQISGDAEKKATLIATIKRVRGSQTLLDRLQGQTPGINFGKDLNTIRVAKKIFFDISVISAGAIGIYHSPQDACLGVFFGFVYSKIAPLQRLSENFFTLVDDLTPNRESFAACDGIEQHARQYATALAFSNPILIGYKFGFNIKLPRA